MPSLGQQLHHARVDVENARRRIEEQSALIERLQSDGHDTGAADRLMATFLDLLGKLTIHRDAPEREAEKRSRNRN